MMSKEKITAEMTFGQVLKMSPEVGKMLKSKFNLACMSCGGVDNETLTLGARAHGLDVDDIIRELNILLDK
jgi:hybrid cluster-associated redox disulfide protein